MSDENKMLDRKKLLKEWAGVWAEIAAQIEKRVSDPTLRELAFRATARAVLRDAL